MIRIVLNLLILVSFLLNLTACSEPPEKSKSEDKTINTVPTTNPSPEVTNLSSPKEIVATNANNADPALTNKPIAQPAELSIFEIRQNDIVLGDIKAKVVVIEYFSPTCPACAAYHKNTYQTIKTKYIDTNKIAYVIRELIANKLDLEAAVLARCNGDKKKYLQFIEVLLSQQQNWATTAKYHEILTNIGQLGGVSAENYAACSKDQKLLETIINNTKEASNIPNFIGTPNFFVSNSKQTTPIMVNPGNILETIEKALQS